MGFAKNCYSNRLALVGKVYHLVQLAAGKSRSGAQLYK